MSESIQSALRVTTLDSTLEQLSIPMVALTHWECLLFLKKKTAVVLAPCLAVVFRRLIRLGCFPVCWRVANVTPIPKGPPSSSASNYRPISLTPILSKVFERLVSVRLGRFYGRQRCASNHPVRL